MAERDDEPPTLDPARLEAAITSLCRRRGPGKTICPSEAARAVGGPDAWRALMPAVRQAAARMAREGRLRVTQKGRPVNAEAAVGPIRLGL